MRYKCTNCNYEGDELSIEPIKDKCPVCGDECTDNGKVIPIIPSIPEELINKAYLNKQNKDWLNDYAVKIGLDEEVSTDMTKKEMIDVILEFKENQE